MSDLVVINGHNLAVPNYIKTGHEGSENVTKDDLIIPRLGICQATNPERKRTSPKFIEGLNEGDMFNTGTQEVYGSKVQVIPLLKNESRIYWQKLDGGGVGGEILCRSRNGIDGGRLCFTCAACPNAQGFPASCTQFKNILSILLPSREVIAVSLKSTALGAAKRWISDMKTRSEKFHHPFYANVYEITTVPTKNAKGEFVVPVIKRVSFVTESDFKFAEQMYHELKDAAYKLADAVEEI